MSAWKRWQDWINVVLGAWLIGAPYALGTSMDSSSTRNAAVAGVLILVVALWALVVPSSTVAEYSNMVLGAWTIVAPFALGYADLTLAAWNAWIVGICVLGLALGVLPAAKRAQAEVSGGQPVAGRRVS